MRKVYFVPSVMSKDRVIILVTSAVKFKIVQVDQYQSYPLM